MQLNWRRSVPISAEFEDPYYSLENGAAETRHVFLDGNALPARFADGFHIAELGFGTGLNLMMALQAWRAAGVAGRLYFTSFEAFPMKTQDMGKALAAFPDLAHIAAEVIPLLGPEGCTLPDLCFQLIVGDARTSLPTWGGRADAWFLDGFSPAKNPQLWEEDLLMQVGQHTAKGGSFATYTAAGHVRRGLEAAGFRIERRPGFGRKRHMTVGWKP